MHYSTKTTDLTISEEDVFHFMQSVRAKWKIENRENLYGFLLEDNPVSLQQELQNRLDVKDQTLV